MKSGELKGKQVIDSQAHLLGTISEIELNENKLAITDIYVELEKTVIEVLGFEKPRVMGSVKISIPVNEIHATSDVISLMKSISELRGIARKV